MSNSSYAVTTICGSMRYYVDMLRVAGKLTNQGQIVLMPHVSDYKGGLAGDVRKEMLDDMHRAKIDMSESITVIGMHIGESTQAEINYAKKTNKTVYYWTMHFGQME